MQLIVKVNKAALMDMTHFGAISLMSYPNGKGSLVATMSPLGGGNGTVICVFPDSITGDRAWSLIQKTMAEGKILVDLSDMVCSPTEEDLRMMGIASADLDPATIQSFQIRVENRTKAAEWADKLSKMRGKSLVEVSCVEDVLNIMVG